MPRFHREVSGVRAFTKNKPQRLGAVASDVDAIQKTGLAQCAQRKLQVLRVVLDKQEFELVRFVHGLFSFSRLK
jgi:hypothetical protein